METAIEAMNEPTEMELHRTAGRRLNIGCGDYPMRFWTNLDQEPGHDQQITAEALEYLATCEKGQYDEIYGGHVLEHLPRHLAVELIQECYRVLTPGGKLGLVVPDMLEVFKRYSSKTIDAVQYPPGVFWPVADLDSVCAMFVYSTVQSSPHLWMWDISSLGRQMALAGFVALREIDRLRDPRLGSPAWYQCGVDGLKPKEGEPGPDISEQVRVMEARFHGGIAALAAVEAGTFRAE